MSGSDLFFLISEVLGGLALFIFGMNVMTEGLRGAAGAGLRNILAKTTRNRISGIMLGNVLGILVQSSAATVMFVGFINAGLMTLVESIPPMLGANIGTTLSMQIISFKLDQYCFFAITLGFIIQMVAPQQRIKQMGKALLGFGLLFLGMKTMSGAIKPYRDVLAPFLATIDGHTLSGTLLGVGIATGITAIIQSSGATIAMVFALINAGVITDLPGAYPIILGANIGTCMTALLGSIGTNIEARRSAISHLSFNLFSAAFGIATAGLFYKYIPMLSHDLVHQAANANTIKMILSALIVLPFHTLFGRLIVFITPSKRKPPQPSFLDQNLLDRPEQAIYAAIRELRRVTQVCAQSLRLNADLFFTSDRKIVQAVKLNEKVVDDIKLAMKDYVTALTNRYLSRRQSILIEHIERCMADIERIGDHIDEFCDVSLRRNKIPEALFDVESFENLFALYKAALNILQLVIESLDPETTDFQGMAKKILAARDAYVNQSMNLKSSFMGKMADRKISPIGGIYFSEYVAALDKIVKHSKTIALAESRPEFWIKRKKLERVATKPATYEIPPLVDPDDFLEQLHSEDYL